MNPEVTVILPFFNAENTLESAIKSILEQTFKDFELLLIDNNSKDKSHSIAKRYSNNHKKIRIINEAKQGVANAMNCGLRNARGKYLARMDSDDISLPDRLEKQVRFLKDNPGTGLVGSNVQYIPHNKNTAGFKRFVDWVNSFHTSNEIELNRFVEIPVINPTILLRKEVFEKHGGCLDGDFPEDYEMQLRYLEAGIKMAKLNESLLEWHDYPKRLTRNDERYSTDAFFKTKAAYFKKWSEKNNPFHPYIWIWGAGRKTRQRAKFIEKEGLRIEGYIDIIKSKPNSTYYKDIPEASKIFVVSMVTNLGAGKQIKEFLLKKDYTEGEDFILMG